MSTSSTEQSERTLETEPKVVKLDPIRIEHRIEGGGTYRAASVPDIGLRFEMGFHGALAQAFNHDLVAEGAKARPSTFDALVIGVAGCLTGSFAIALTGRKLSVGDDGLRAEARAELGPDEIGVLVVKRIHVHYTLKLPKNEKDKIDRALKYHEQQCNVSRSVKAEVTTSYELV